MNSSDVLIKALLAKEDADRKLLAQDGLFICMSCGATNDYFKYSCEACETVADYQQEDRR